MEFKQNKFLPADKQIVTANPDVNIVSTERPFQLLFLRLPNFGLLITLCLWPLQVELCDDDEFIVLACDGIW